MEYVMMDAASFWFLEFHHDAKKQPRNDGDRIYRPTSVSGFEELIRFLQQTRELKAKALALGEARWLGVATALRFFEVGIRERFRETERRHKKKAICSRQSFDLPAFQQLT